MFDFRLKVFYVVAKRLNFTKAAAELYISQPAVSKHIQELETYYATKLFHRNGSRIRLTKTGAHLLKNTEKLMELHRRIDIEMAAHENNSKGTLKIGASTTVAQYYLPKYIASFRQKYPDIQVSMVSNNTEAIENMLTENQIDLGIVEGQSKRQNIKYNPITKDEIVLCTRTSNQLIRKPLISIEELKNLPLILRESGSGSLDVIASILSQHGVNISGLKKEIELQSTESIKSYLLHSDSFAFLSIHSIFKELRDNELRIIDIKGLEFERSFFGIVNQGDMHKLQELFLDHISALP
ncbi:LysR family transcriptional regulator [Sediminibacterium ginsengisoli]|uniref:DNA-binding transcriptional regulator, LysR family n=1 Tax=Sediminibacterium ginsengisoli TaxID=413434 RepID=A0A1T4R2P2_9BACT|nr:LysR family transcriptional regulator [Sediminibacterium ginsengisoli]SKA09868.1 DNA-binding transcriptional regulator, LysR family [Sediminibacterium ginsengisoli]